MNRRDFNQLMSVGAAGILLPALPAFSRTITAEELREPGLDVSIKKRLADAALNAATAKGATYADVRIGRYLNQYVMTREDKVQNIINTESFGVGVRVIANGCWGFAAIGDTQREEVVARTAEKAVAFAKAHAKLLKKPVQLAPQKGFGEVSWKTPVQKNSRVDICTEHLERYNNDHGMLDRIIAIDETLLKYYDPKDYWASRQYRLPGEPP